MATAPILSWEGLGLIQGSGWLFKELDLHIGPRDRLALIGRNGAGKTTLLRMLARETSIDGGDLSFQKGCKVALHDQRPPRDRELTLRDYILSGASEPLALEARLQTELGQTADHKEAVEAFLAKRTPEFTGR